MSKNNVNQTINEVKATTQADTDNKVSIETTKAVSKEVYETYRKEARNIVETVNSSAMDLARIYTEMTERKVLEYVSDDKEDKFRYANMSDFAREELGLELSERQLNDYAKVIHFYGTQLEDGTYTIDAKYSKYKLSNLEIISRGIVAKKGTKANFDDFVEANGITPYTSGTILKEINNRLKGIESKDTTKDNTKEATKDTSKERDKDTIKVSEIKAQPEYKAVADELTICRDFIALAYTKADTKEFGKWFKEQFKELEKTCKLARDNNK